MPLDRREFSTGAAAAVALGLGFGMHLDFPGLAYVWREANGYSFLKAVWSNKV